MLWSGANCTYAAGGINSVVVSEAGHTRTVGSFVTITPSTGQLSMGLYTVLAVTAGVSYTINNSNVIAVGGNATCQNISMGGTVDARASIELELGKTGTAVMSMNDADFRAVAGVTTGAVSLSNFYGKDSTTWAINESTGASVSKITSAWVNPVNHILYTLRVEQTAPYYRRLSDISTRGFNVTGTDRQSTNWAAQMSSSGQRSVISSMTFDASNNLILNHSHGTGFYRMTLAGGLETNSYSLQSALGHATYAVAVDSAGAIYAGGEQVITSGTRTYPIIAKFTAAGAVTWQRNLQVPAANFGSVQSIACDGTTNVIVGGMYYPTATTIMVGFVASYSSAGVLTWQKKITGGTSGCQVRTIKTDAFSNIYALLYMQGNNPAIIKFNSAGTVVWNYECSGIGFNDCYIDSIGSSGDLIFLGLTGIGGVIARINSTGTLAWNKSFSYAESGFTYGPNCVTVDYSVGVSRMYISGKYNQGTTRNFVWSLPLDGSATSIDNHPLTTSSMTLTSVVINVIAAGTLVGVTPTTTVTTTNDSAEWSSSATSTLPWTRVQG